MNTETATANDWENELARRDAEEAERWRAAGLGTGRLVGIITTSIVLSGVILAALGWVAAMVLKTIG